MSPSSYFAPRKALIVLLGLTMSLAMAAKLSPLPQCGQTCAQTAATALGCSLDDDACLCAHPGFSKGADSCAQSVCRSPEDKKASSDAFGAFAASCGNGTTVTVTTTQSGSASNSASASASSGTNSAHSASSTKPTTTPTTTQPTTKPTGTVTTSTQTQTTPTTITGSVTPTVTSGSIITTPLVTPATPLLPTSPSGTAVVVQTVVMPDPSASPINAAYSVHASSVWSLGALLMGLAGVTLF